MRLIITFFTLNFINIDTEHNYAIRCVHLSQICANADRNSIL